MTTHKVDDEFGAVKDDLAKLRADIASLSSALKDVTSDTVREQVESIRGRIDQLTDEAKSHGRQTVDDLAARIEERPLASILIAFGAGILIGRLLDR